jgi:hypothetical protein
MISHVNILHGPILRRIATTVPAGRLLRILFYYDHTSDFYKRGLHLHYSRVLVQPSTVLSTATEARVERERKSCQTERFPLVHYVDMYQ